MEPARHLEIIRDEGGRLAGVPIDALDAPVPGIEGWDLQKLVRHVGNVHRWAAGALRLAPGQAMEEIVVDPMPKGPECVAAYRSSLDDLVAAMEAREPDEPCVTFLGMGTVGWWMRRQAQEISVHRVDAQDAVHAAGGPAPDPLAVDGAADGIDEWARLFVSVRFEQRFGAFPDDLDGRSIHLHGTDDPAPADGCEWHLSFTDGKVTVEPIHAKGDVAARGSCPDLLLALWRRRPRGDVEVLGDRTVLDRFLDVARF